jgi:hypothetical protein
MKNLSPQRRRAAVLAAACAAIIPSTTILMERSQSRPLEFADGLLIGLAFTLTIGLVVRTRHSCS